MAPIGLQKHNKQKQTTTTTTTAAAAAAEAEDKENQIHFYRNIFSGKGEGWNRPSFVLNTGSLGLAGVWFIDLFIYLFIYLFEGGGSPSLTLSPPPPLPRAI